MTEPIPINNDEIELTCDLLFFVKRESELSTVGEALWERLQPMTEFVTRLRSLLG